MSQLSLAGTSELPEPSCVLSPCGRYRYLLRLPLAVSGGVCCFIMANPSTAVVENGVFRSDRTVSRCMEYARDWGFGELIVANARAWRETDPDLVPPDPLAIGPENDDYISIAAEEANLVVCGWGKLGGERGAAVLRVILSAAAVPHALKLNQDGSPQHPLYLSKALKPFPMEVA